MLRAGLPCAPARPRWRGPRWVELIFDRRLSLPRIQLVPVAISIQPKGPTIRRADFRQRDPPKGFPQARFPSSRGAVRQKKARPFLKSQDQDRRGYWGCPVKARKFGNTIKSRIKKLPRTGGPAQKSKAPTCWLVLRIAVAPPLPLSGGARFRPANASDLFGRQSTA